MTEVCPGCGRRLMITGDAPICLTATGQTTRERPDSPTARLHRGRRAGDA